MTNTRYLCIAAFFVLVSALISNTAVVVACTNKLVTPFSNSTICNYDGTATTYFGYNNENDETVSMNPGSFNNRFIPDPKTRGQPGSFLPGVNSNVFSVTWSISQTYNWIKWQTRSNTNSGNVQYVKVFWPEGCPSPLSSTTSTPVVTSASTIPSEPTTAPTLTTAHSQATTTIASTTPPPCHGDNCFINGPPITVHESSSVSLESIGDGLFRLCAVFDNSMGIFWMASLNNLTFCKINEINPPPQPPQPSGTHFDLYRVCDTYVPYAPVLQQDDCGNMRTDHYANDFNTLLETGPYYYHGWVYSLVTPNGTRQRACHDFSIQSIGQCRSRNYVYGQDESDITPLVTVNQNGMHMNGSVYINAYDKVGCDDLDGECQNLRHSIRYNVDVVYKTGGQLHVLVMTGTVDITLTWVKIVWMPDNRVMIILKTSISQLDQPSGNPPIYTTKLSDFEVISAHETGGVTVQVVQYTDCLESSPPDRCEQLFMLLTDYPVIQPPMMMNRVGDFQSQYYHLSGYKPVKTEIIVDGSIHLATAILHVNLDIDHGEDPDFEDEFDAYALAFHDRQMTQPYSTSEIGQRLLVDCSKLFILVQGQIPQCYDLQIINVSVCSSLDGFMTPYDSDHPYTTACNTPGIDILWGLVWSRDPNYIPDPQFNGEYLSEYEHDHNREGVGMSIHKFGETDQYVVVNYEVVAIPDCQDQHPSAKRGMNAVPIPKPGIKTASISSLLTSSPNTKSPVVLGNGKGKVFTKHDEDNEDFDNCNEYRHKSNVDHEHGCLIHIYPDCPEDYIFDHSRHQCVSDRHVRFHGWFSHYFWWFLLTVFAFTLIIMCICGKLCAGHHRISRGRAIYQRHKHKHKHKHSVRNTNNHSNVVVNGKKPNVKVSTSSVSKSPSSSSKFQKKHAAPGKSQNTVPNGSTMVIPPDSLVYDLSEPYEIYTGQGDSDDSDSGHTEFVNGHAVYDGTIDRPFVDVVEDSKTQ